MNSAEAEIFEIGPRDGLQNESRMIPAPDKVRLVDLLSRTGLRKIEATSFVSGLRMDRQTKGRER